MIDAAADPESPYKFLDAYRDEDRDVFFGREAETEILLADILVGRIVILFARTGTGKTSLIDAGVRPVLHDRGYATFRIRVRRDPITSATDVLRAHPQFSDGASSLGDAVAAFARRLGKPLVLFFDQFEEFFLYVVREDIARAREFIGDVARLLEDASLGVHLVFSMREEFFSDLDLFRDEIPTIFHKDSNLRLRWFDKRQARTAILRPAACRGVRVDRELVHRLVADLAAVGEKSPRAAPPFLVEPAQLQIVCSALWPVRTDGRLTLAAYEAAGASVDGNVAERLLEQSLQSQLEQIQSKEQLELLERLLPQLRTDRDTKWVRDYDGLRKDLGADDATLRELLERLEEAGLVERPRREEVELVELTHDYLVERLDDLARAMRLVLPRRILAAGTDALASAGTLLRPDDLAEVLEKLDELEPSRVEADLVLRSALADAATDVARVLAAVERSGVDPWPVLAERLEQGDEVEAAHAIETLGRAEAPQAAELLDGALAGDDETAERVLGVLGRVETPLAVDVVRRALDDERLRPQAQAALARLASSWGAPAVAQRAAEALGEALDDEEVSPALAEALLSLAASRHVAVAARAIPLLAKVEEVRAVRVLERRLEDAELGPEALQALRRLRSSGEPDVAAQARAALGEAPPAPAAAPPAGKPTRRPPSPRPEEAGVSSRRVPPAELDSHLRFVVDSIFSGRVVPFLGAGVNLVGRPPDASWAPGAFLPSGHELSEHLAREFAYPAGEPPDLLRVSQYLELTTDTAFLYEQLHRIFAADYQPTPAHLLLAELPTMLRHAGRTDAHQLILTTNYDALLESAFDVVGEPFDVVYYVAEGEHAGMFWHRPPGGDARPIQRPEEYRELSLTARTVILKLHGSVSRESVESDSYVVTEDDFVDYMTRSDLIASIPAVLAARLLRSSFLFLGYSLRDWNLRAVLHRIWREQRVRVRSWAVLRDPSPLDQSFWRERGVEVLDLPLEEYVDILRARLEDAQWS